MPRRVNLPEQLAARPFTVDEAASLGVKRGRLRGSDLARPFYGVRAPAPVTDLAFAYAVRMPANQHFSHWTAARLLGLPVPRRTAPLHVTAVAPAKPPRGRGVIGHATTQPASTTTVHGLRVATPVATWVAMSTELSHRELVVLGDALVRRERPLATIESLADAVIAHRGKRGAVALAAAFARVRPRTDSVRETLLRLAIVDFGLPEPEVNVTVRDPRGRLIAIADLAYCQWRVIAEYDGDQHRTDDRQFFRDVDRLDDLAEERWRVVRFNKSHVTSARLVKLRRALLAAGWRP